MTKEEEHNLVEKARSGDKVALAELVKIAQQLSYHLSIRMVPDPVEAQDLTQEVLIRVVTGLAKFRGDSSFRTWVYKVASNHLLTARRRLVEQQFESLEELATRLADGVSDGTAAQDLPLEDQLTIKEAKLECTSRMLLGLDRDHRLAFILGEVLELSSEEGAAVLEIDPAAFRKRLSRARERMASFTEANCGVVKTENACRCALQGARLARLGYFDPARPRWTCHPARDPVRGSDRVEGLDGLGRALQVFRAHPDYAAPALLAEGLRRLIATDTSGLMG